MIARSDEVPVVVDVWAPWCGPCKTLGPLLEAVVDETGGAVELVTVNVDENPQVAAAFQVQSIPAVFAMRDGKVVDGFIGAVAEPAVRDFVGRLEPAPSAADRLVAAGDEASLRQALDLQPDHPGAVVALAELLIAANGTEEALALLARIPETEQTRRLAAQGPPRRPGQPGVRFRSTRAWRTCSGGCAPTRPPARSTSTSSRRWNPRTPGGEATAGRSPRSSSERRGRADRPPRRRAAGGTRLRRASAPGRYDVTARALVMGIVNRTPDSFYDHGATFELDSAIRRAEAAHRRRRRHHRRGRREGRRRRARVSAAEELDRVVPAIEAIAARFDVALSVDTWRAAVAKAAYAAGAVLGNDISGFADPDYLAVAAAAGASVVATHIRLRPRVDDPDPRYPDDDVVAAVEQFLADRLAMAMVAGIPAERVLLDVGLDLGKTTPQSLELLRATDRFARMGQTMLLSASNKGFLGDLLGLGIEAREDASLAAVAIGVACGCRVGASP